MSDSTIVTALYDIPMDFTVGQMKAWFSNLCKIEQPMVIFTSEEFVFEIHQWRKDLMNKTEIIIRTFDSFAMMCPAMITFWSQQWSRDPEKGEHRPETYAMWSMKQEFVRIVIKRNPFRSQWFVWCDCSMQRFPEMEPFYRYFPLRVPELCEPGRMTLLEVEKIPDEYVRNWIEEKPVEWPVPLITIDGGCMAGDKDAWDEFSEVYKDMLQEFAIRGWFCGLDRTVYFVALMEDRYKKPFRLFFAEAFGPPKEKYTGIEWLSLPAILGGSVRAVLDTRFEEEEGNSPEEV